MLDSDKGQWTIEEQDCLIRAIESRSSISGIIKEAKKEINRSDKSILRRLKKIGYSPKAVGKYIAGSNLGV
ncbi:hypothetical protein [Microbulbifer epialgicus]|uniref:Uncharacterized protein n=1 Tax=Microbulbifer epialgicus TaxID=393907 RepID=A0ABV4P510_9GAMM